MKSNINIRSILIVAIIGILVFVVFGKCFAADTAKVRVDTANVRRTADVDSEIIEQAFEGEEVQILEKVGEWYKVRYNNVEGYIRADLLDIGTSTVTEEPVIENTNTEPAAPTTTEPATENKVEEQKTEVVATESKVENKTGMYVCKQDTKLRIMPLINGLVIKEIKADETLNVLEVNNKWAFVESGINKGWVLVNKIEQVKDEEPTEPQEQEETGTEQEEEQVEEETIAEITMYVNSEIINLREQPTTSSDSLARLTIGTEVNVNARVNGWSKVNVNGTEGYILSSLLSERKPEETTSRALEEREDNSEEEEEPEEQTWSAPSGGSATGQAICDFARQFEGCDYVYGGTTPDGFDCSGFTQFVFSNFGYDINRTASAQAYNGTYVSRDDLQAGDLLIFNGHAGLYLGDGTFIHAENPRTGVVITDIDASYYVRNYLQARRIAE